jgi:hypothetical protein
MRSLDEAPKRLRRIVGTDWLLHESGSYLCGNCYHDLKDEEASR